MITNINIYKLFLKLTLAQILISCQSASEIKQKQYFVEGLELYKTHCANCHQLDGSGLAGLYPTINKAATYINNKGNIICKVKNGSIKTLENNKKMPANPKLENLDIAEISTYINTQWGNAKGITTIEEVEKALAVCK